MSDDRDKRIENVKDHIGEDLVDEAGEPADKRAIAEAVDAAAASFAEAPVQEFVPLLVEHDARDELRKQGLHRDLGDDDSAPPSEEPDGSTQGSIHLSGHQGVVAPDPDP